MNIFGEHVVHCQRQPNFKYLHDMVRDVLYDIIWREGIPGEREFQLRRRHQSTVSPFLKKLDRHLDRLMCWCIVEIEGNIHVLSLYESLSKFGNELFIVD